jgi:hypothetical protein
LCYKLADTFSTLNLKVLTAAPFGYWVLRILMAGLFFWGGGGAIQVGTSIADLCAPHQIARHIIPRFQVPQQILA